MEQSKVKYRFTEAEKIEAGEKIGLKIAELEEAKAAKKDVTKELKEAIDRLEKEIGSMGRALRDGYEWRDAPALPFPSEHVG